MNLPLTPRPSDPPFGPEMVSADSRMATSSNLVSVVRYGRAIRGHVMDPATGWPAHRCRQVTVVARTGLAADALSTAALVSPKALGLVRRSWVV